MLFNPFNTRSFAPDGAGAGAAVVDDPPQEEVDEKGDATHPEDEGGEEGEGKAKPKVVEAEGKEAGEEVGAEEEEIEIDGLEEMADGRIKYTIGNSTYLSKDGLKGNRAITDVLRQHFEAEPKKDDAFHALKQESAKEKAAKAIVVPKNLDEEAEKPPPIPRLEDITSAMLKQRGLQAGMDTWGKAQWMEYQDNNSLRDWEVTEAKAIVKEVTGKSAEVFEGHFKTHNNWKALKDAEADVRDMLSDIDGVNPDDYTAEFLNTVRRAKKDGLNEFGEISANWILKEMGKVVGKTLNSRQKSQLQAQIEKEIAENKNRRQGPKPPASTAARLKVAGKEVKSIADATRLIMDEERKRGSV